jgi:protein ImuB
MFVASSGKSRDLDAANRALARLRAEFGDAAVVRAQLKDAHLPEASFGWEPIERVQVARPEEVDLRPLIRRIRRRPEPVSLGRLEMDDGAELSGPFVVSGGWWAGEVHRDYHFAEGEDGEIVWVYWDERRERWFLQGGLK